MSTLRAALVPALAAALGAACTSSSSAPHGSPVLVKVYWVLDGARTPVWSRDPDPALQGTGAPLASEVDFVFDRLLDGNRIEDTVTVNGTVTTQPKVSPPVTVTWPDASSVMSSPPFGMQVFYNSLPLFGGTSAYVFGRPVTVGFPSATTVSFLLDRTGLTSAYDEPMDGPDHVDVLTGPFTVAIAAPASDGGAGVDTTFQVPLVFTGRPSGPASVAPFVTVQAGGAAVPFELLVDARTPARLYLAPAACAGAWPPGATVAVMLAAGLPDAFGVPLAAGVAASFVTRADGPAPADGGCPAP